ncbi:YfjI family protein [Ramlibacter tataouinensis]|uniref:YfjI family protein n=1 Tax=Ramlibacter tataouinensis TaxID=94132 RepID=UPI0022F3843C|nr:YfjI family protein [Ramlibacter tataouinensis]WBY02760.1 YfjI family protein [Ramlibacter tataouinensis]
MKQELDHLYARLDADIEDQPPVEVGIDWPEPREIKSELPVAPPFQATEMLPRPLAEFVLDEATRMPCAPDYIGAALVVALGAVIGSKCALKPKRRDDWLVTPNLYGGVVGEPSAKKTPAVSTVMRFIDRLEKREALALVERKKIYEAEKAAYEAHQAAIKTEMKSAAKGDKQDKMLTAMADFQKLEEPQEPTTRRFKTNDATAEKIADLLAHNPAGLLVYRDELVGLWASWERDGREGDRALYLEGWNGTGSFNVDRIARGSVFVPNVCLSVFGGIQPDILERYLRKVTGSLDNDGAMQRFQVLVFPDAPRWEWRDQPPHKGAREAVRDAFERLASFDPVQDGARPADDFVKLPHFSFDDQAQDVFIAWCGWLHEQIESEQHPLVAQHLGKYEKLFCAVALVLHLAEGNIGPIGASCAQRAVRWCEYLAGHARRIYSLLEAGRVTTARSISRRIRQGKLSDWFTARDVYKKGWGDVRSTAEAEVALAVLEEFGWVRSFDISEQPGRPTTRYLINPKVRPTGTAAASGGD